MRMPLLAAKVLSFTADAGTWWQPLSRLCGARIPEGESGLEAGPEMEAGEWSGTHAAGPSHTVKLGVHGTLTLQKSERVWGDGHLQGPQREEWETTPASPGCPLRLPLGGRALKWPNRSLRG